MAKRTGGGVILFGLNEETDFKIVGVGDAQRLQEDLTSLASAEMEPALRPELTVDEIEGETVGLGSTRNRFPGPTGTVSTVQLVHPQVSSGEVSCSSLDPFAAVNTRLLKFSGAIGIVSFQGGIRRDFSLPGRSHETSRRP